MSENLWTCQPSSELNPQEKLKLLGTLGVPLVDRKGT